MDNDISGMCSNLFPKDVIAAGEWNKISDLCRSILALGEAGYFIMFCF